MKGRGAEGSSGARRVASGSGNSTGFPGMPNCWARDPRAATRTTRAHGEDEGQFVRRDLVRPAQEDPARLIDAGVHGVALDQELQLLLQGLVVAARPPR